MAENVLDKYRVIAQLGRGGMADVYLAAAHGPGGFAKLLVVKVLQPTLARDPQFLTMFRDEARLSARLNHPNVIQTYEVGESEGRHYIAMEFLEGQPLHRVVDRFGSQGGITPSLALKIVIDGLAGLHYAHELADFDGRPLGVVHRDITPQNVFLTYEGQIKLVDFGIAKASDSSTETNVGTVKGKVAYMAPEQARGELVDRRADLFSMGVILWELLSGRRLWEGLTDIAVVGKLVQGDIPNLEQVRPDLSPGLARACMRALQPEKSSRPATALEFQKELEIQFEEMTSKFSSRRLGELLRDSFAEERGQVRGVVRKQLEKLARTTPTGITPPGGWRLSASPGDMPILGEGSAVHDAVTALHTGLTDPTNRSGSIPAALGSGAITGTTNQTVIQQDRGALWIAVAAVGIAGLAIGVAAPWTKFQEKKDDSAAVARAEATRSTTPTPAAARPPSTPTGGCGGDSRPVVELTGEISEDATLTCDKTYLLRFTTIVTPGVTLTIQPGTVLHGDTETKGVLVVQPGGRLMARGTADRPIVFTSDKLPSERRPGDWGGVILLGQAPVNLRDAQGQPTTGRVEGLTTGGDYGGQLVDDSSGALTFVRIEYSGTQIAPNNEVNGLTLAGVGRGTEIHHVEVRHTADDCFEFFGGTVDGKYLVCQGSDDDSFDWDYGYTGRLQFLVAQSGPGATEGSHGIEGDNDPRGSKNEPVSAPLVYNATFCGKNRILEAKEHYGMLLRRGTQGRIRNAIFMGFGAGLDVQDAATKPNIAASLFFNNLVFNLAYPESHLAKRTERLLFDDDAGFDENVYLTNPGLKISTRDPEIGNCYDPQSPSWKPRAALLNDSAEPPDDGFFDPRATYLGAFRDRQDGWDQGEWLVWGP